jgi:acyl-CoA reductase-like NAD-dependent aldehyde dehydrogenase
MTEVARQPALPPLLAEPLGLFIDGGFKAGTGGDFTVVDPSTGAPLATTTLASPTDVDLAAAGHRGPAWPGRTTATVGSTRSSGPGI